MKPHIKRQLERTMFLFLFNEICLIQEEFDTNFSKIFDLIVHLHQRIDGTVKIT